MKTLRSFIHFSAAAVLLFASSVLLSPLAAYADDARQFSKNQVLTGGMPLEVTVVGMESQKAGVENLVDQAISNVARLDATMFAPGGLAERLDSLGKGESISLPPEVFSMIARASVLANQTDGFYDIAAPSPKGWFTQRDWRRIVLDEKSHSLSYKSDGMKLDLKRIAPAFFTDTIASSLLAAGFNNFMVEAGPVRRFHGRDIYTSWNLNVGFGQTEPSAYAQRVQNYSLTDAAVATVTPSGLGQGFIDGRTKSQVAPNLMRSITILSNDAMTAEAFALAVYALGPKYGMKYVESHPAIKAIMVDNNGTVVASAGLASSNPALAPKWPETGGRENGPMNLKQKEQEEAQDQ